MNYLKDVDLMKSLKNNDNIIVGYGIGQNFYSNIHKFIDNIKFDYFCDKTYTQFEKDKFLLGISKITKEELFSMDRNIILIVFPKRKQIVDELREECLFKNNIHIIDSADIYQDEIAITAEEFITVFNSKYCDGNNNCIYIKGGHVPSNWKVIFKGCNNALYIDENNLFDGKVEFVLGNEARISIGANSRFGNVTFISSFTDIEVGNDCLFSSGIVCRTIDGHHIFDLNSHKRINIPKKIIVSNHVWVGQEVMLLGGASIGDGSVIGARTITSSRFPKNVIIAGVPGKIIKENIIWNRDAEYYFNRDELEECLASKGNAYL